MHDYYAQRLSAERLRQCYDIAPPRVRQYLQAEIDYVADRIRPGDLVLELGCGYGRVLEPLADKAALVIGIDTSRPSLELARELLGRVSNCRLVRMDAAALGFRDRVFDLVACIQNGISAFKVDQRKLLAEAIRVTRPGGRVLFSSYAEKFWEQRLEWFRLQAAHGLLGAIDWAATGHGTIVCQDGFKATTITPAEFRSLTSGFDVQVRVEEVDESSTFCEIVV
jgi:2-polyprenyl-6-hydroxyphenyl methylase/3-demethylubiquinone-9 3-methyltransferase